MGIGRLGKASKGYEAASWGGDVKDGPHQTLCDTGLTTDKDQMKRKVYKAANTLPSCKTVSF